MTAIEARLDLGQDLLDDVRMAGDYARYLARARDKHSYLAARGLMDPTPEDCGQMPIALVAWHFERRAGRRTPDDLVAYVRRLGLAQPADFYRALAREWLYSQRG
jgi:hypothetical protein